MTQTRCPHCRARRPASMPHCPVCAGPAGASPRFDKAERTERRELHESLKPYLVAEVVLTMVIALVVWLLRG